jgi:hypothetical protein
MGNYDRILVPSCYSNLEWWCFAGIRLAWHSRRKPLKHRELMENYASIALYACCSRTGNAAPKLPPFGGGRRPRGKPRICAKR